ncbi:MAG TPA: choice-of-anchor Q domain-containing protein [Armatimonadota bacterium]|jgi:hypothetical protein
MNRFAVTRSIAPLFLLCLCPGLLRAAVIRVDQEAAGPTRDGSSWKTAFTSIQSGLNAAHEGDEVWVAAGTYFECITMPNRTAIYGGFAGSESAREQRDPARNAVIIDGNRLGTTVMMKANGTVDGFTIQHAGYDPNNRAIFGGGIDAEGGTVTITHNIIRDNAATGYGGGVFLMSGEVAFNTLVDNAATDRGGGVGSWGGEINVHNNVFVGNSAPSGGALAASVGEATFANNLVVGNASHFAAVMFERGVGICANNTIAGNTTIGSEMGYVACGLGFDGGMPLVANNVVAFNDTGMATWDGYGAPVDDMASNCVFGNAKGDYLRMPDVTGMNGNVNADPRFAGAGGGDYRPGSNSPCIDAGSDAAIEAGWIDLDGRPRWLGTHVDIGAYEAPAPPPNPPAASRVYLSPRGADSNDGLTWNRAKRSVHAATLAIAPGGELWLAAGDYAGYGEALPPRVSIYGGFDGTETDRGGRRPAVNVSTISPANGGGLVVGPGGGPETVLDGFTLSGGGRGITCDRSSPTISNVSFLGCYGGVDATGGSPVIRDCSFVGGGDSVTCHGGAPEIRRNRLISRKYVGTSGNLWIRCFGCTGAVIRDNTIAPANGASGGIVCDTSTAAIVGNVLTQCDSVPLDSDFTRRGIIGIRGSGGWVTVARNTLSGGSADSIVCYGGATARIADNVVTLSAGAAVSCRDASVILDNNTIVRNGGSTGALDVAGAVSATLRNNIVAFNAAGAALPPSGAAASHNCVYANLQWDYSGGDPTGAKGNTRVDPRFAGLDYGDLHLLADSPCRDAGEDTAVQTGEVDADGRARIIGRHVDIGAYESDGMARSRPAAIVRVALNGNDSGDGSSWRQAKRTVQGAVDALPPLGGEVWVAGGAYPELITLRAGARVYGGFAGWETRRGERTLPRTARARALARTTSVVPPSGDLTIPTTAPGAVWDGFRMEGNYLWCRAAADISHNVFAPAQRAGDDAGLTVQESSPRIQDNLFFGAGSFAALRVWSGSPAISNNTFLGNGLAISILLATPRLSNNLIAYGGTALSADQSSPVLRNNCAYGNDVDYSGVTDPTGRDGNIRRDPAIVSAAFGDARLEPNSPCVNSGDNSAAAPGDTDIEGRPRLIGSRVDIGAYESDGQPIPRPATPVIRVSTNGSDAWDGSSWGRAKRTIQAAIDAATDGGSEIWVAGGTYAENIVIPPYVYAYGGYSRTTSVRTGRDPRANETTISGDGKASVICLVGGHRTNRLDGFTVRIDAPPAANTNAVAVAIASGSPVVNNCIVGRITVDPRANSPVIAGCRLNGGITLAGMTPTLTSCLVRGDVTVDSGSTASVTNNVITGSSRAGIGGWPRYLWCVNNTIVGNVGGVSHMDPKQAYFANNIVAFNGTGVYSPDAKPANFRSNCVFGNADDFQGGKDITGWAGNIHVDPRLADPQHGVVALLPDSPCRDAGDNSAAANGQTDAAGGPRFIGSSVDMGGLESNGSAPAVKPPPVFRVSASGADGNSGASWKTALRTVRAGLAAAQAAGGGEVWVARGVYVESLKIGAYTNLYGGFAGNETSPNQRPESGAETVLDGGGKLGPIVTAVVGFRNSTVDGFTIRNAQSASWYPFYSFSAVSAVEASAVVLSHDVITGNTAAPDMWGNPAPGTVVDIRGPGVITDCDILDNEGSGIVCGSVAPAIIARNLVSGNRAYSAGGGLSLYGVVTAKDNVIDGNSAGRGGGIYVGSYGSVSRLPIIANNTIVNNRADDGGGIYVNWTYGEAPALVNNIVANNSSGVMLPGGFSGPTSWLRCNDVFGNDGSAYINVADQTGVNGNLAGDPMFLDPRDGNWVPGARSPCVDAGADDAVAPPDTDFYGNPRIAGAHVDIGAVEAQPAQARR